MAGRRPAGLLVERAYPGEAEEEHEQPHHEDAQLCPAPRGREGGGAAYGDEGELHGDAGVGAGEQEVDQRSHPAAAEHR